MRVDPVGMLVRLTRAPAMVMLLAAGAGGSYATGTTTAGRTYYVATTGSDANLGTEALPFRTLAHSVAVLEPGDTLFVRAGTYAEAIHDIPSGTWWSAPVTVAAYPGETATVKPGVTGWPAVYLYNRSYIVLRRLVFDCAGLADQIGVFIDDASHHIRLEDCEVKNAPMDGIYIDASAHHNEMINMAIHHNGTTDFDHGIYIRGASNLVESSEIYQNAGWGVHVFKQGGTGVANYNIVRNNRIHDNARIGARGVGIILSSGNGNLAYNNLIWGNTGGIQIAYGTPTGTEVCNNTIYANRNYGIRIYSDGTDSIVKNNILYENETWAYGAQFSDSGTGTQSSNNLIGIDPMFVDVPARDFHLQAGSPAIDQGVPVSIVTTDFDGTPRPQGAAVDIGAFEYNSGGPLITRIRSKKATPGSRITVFGSGFSPDATLNTVYFEARRAAVTKATESSLKTRIPKELKKGSVGVYVTVNGTRSNTMQFQVK